jgi:hypothetical protein
MFSFFGFSKKSLDAGKASAVKLPGARILSFLLIEHEKLSNHPLYVLRSKCNGPCVVSRWFHLQSSRSSVCVNVFVARGTIKYTDSFSLVFNASEVVVIFLLFRKEREGEYIACGQ